ncbi:hypothetical protein KKD37_04480 [Patescibacteria group bacterium]|nr:hypothetical protein [Patescibacteria group bacterium]
MSSHCQHCDDHENSSFIFGLLFGLVIGAIIAIVIYRQNKGKVFDDLKKQLAKFFDIFQNPPSPKNSKTKPPFIPTAPRPQSVKKEVVIPSKLIASAPIKKATVSKPKKMFKK